LRSSALARSRKPRQGRELLCEHLFRPLAHLVVLALLPLRAPPPAVVLASTAAGLGGAVELTRGRLERAPRFYTIQGPGGRWFVDNMEIAAVREFCRESGTMNSKR